MTNREAYERLKLPGIQMTMENHDRKTREAFKIAMESLKKQIPIGYTMKYKETVRVEIDVPEDVDVFTFHCPCCDAELGDSDWDGIPDEAWRRFCDNCGQRINWVANVPIPQFERKKKKQWIRKINEQRSFLSKH